MSESEDLQFKFRIERQLFDRLERAAAKAGYSSANKFAAEALDAYTELLCELLIERAAESRKIAKAQRDRLFSESPPRVKK